MGLTFSAGVHLSVCFLIYAIVTILPFFFLDCPYSTPYTPLTWRLYHLYMFAISLLVTSTLYIPLALLAPSLLEIFNKKTTKHMRRCWHGRKRSIELYTSDAPDAGTLVQRQVTCFGQLSHLEPNCHSRTVQDRCLSYHQRRRSVPSCIMPCPSATIDLSCGIVCI